jgi:hypothetical protein
LDKRQGHKRSLERLGWETISLTAGPSNVGTGVANVVGDFASLLLEMNLQQASERSDCSRSLGMIPTSQPKSPAKKHYFTSQAQVSNIASWAALIAVVARENVIIRHALFRLQLAAKEHQQ